MLKKVTIGLDVGTSSLKVSVYNIESGSFEENYNVYYDESGSIRAGVSTLKKYTDAIISTVNDLVKKFHVNSLALSTQMYSFIAVEKQEKIVYQWNVPWERNEEVEEVLSKFSSISGCPIDTLYPSYKVLDLVSQKAYQGNVLCYGLQEAIIEELTGIRAGDYCNISSYGYLNVRNGTWNEELLSMLGFDVEKMPLLLECNQKVGSIVNDQINCGYEITVACGLGDGPSASYATRQISPLLSNVGTAISVRGFLKQDDINQIDFYSQRNYCYMINKNTWVIGGLSSNGCGVLDDFRKQGLLDDSEINIKDNEGKVLYFPWKNGERSPYWSSSLKEVMLGGSYSSDKNSYASAVYKGVCFSLSAVYYEVMKAGFSQKDKLIIAGGGAKSKIFMELLSGVLPAELVLLSDFDFLGSYGAAYAAAEAVGVEPNRNIDTLSSIAPTNDFLEEYLGWKKEADSLAEYFNSVNVWEENK